MDAVAAATVGLPRLYAINSVPASPGYPYGSYSAALGRGAAYTADESHGVRLGGVTVQTFGKTADSALDLMERVIDVLLDVRLLDSTPLKAALDSPATNRDPDDNGVVTATMHFTFTKEN
jgi:hypothetical protein